MKGQYQFNACIDKIDLYRITQEAPDGVNWIVVVVDDVPDPVVMAREFSDAWTALREYFFHGAGRQVGPGFGLWPDGAIRPRSALGNWRQFPVSAETAKSVIAAYKKKKYAPRNVAVTWLQ